jgi:tRNA A22 N-methylase
MSNPFGDASAKAKAKADLDAVKSVQADVTKAIEGVQGKVGTIPGMATDALAKLTASFAAST